MDLMLASLPTSGTGGGVHPDSGGVDQMQVDTPCACTAGSSVPKAPTPQTRSSAAAAAAAVGASSSCEDAMMAEQAAARHVPRNPADAPMRKLSISLIDTYKLINQVKRVSGWMDGRIVRLFALGLQGCVGHDWTQLGHACAGVL